MKEEDKERIEKEDDVLYEATKQLGKPGHCYQAQIFKNGKAFIAIEPTEDPWEATKTAFFLTKALYGLDSNEKEFERGKIEGSNEGAESRQKEIDELKEIIRNINGKES